MTDNNVLENKHSLTVLNYIEQNPGCIQEDVRVAVLNNGGTLRTTCDVLKDDGIISEVVSREGKRRTLTIHFHPTKKGVAVAHLYRLIKMVLNGTMRADDEALMALMDEKFGDGYRDSLRRAGDIPKSEI